MTALKTKALPFALIVLGSLGVSVVSSAQPSGVGDLPIATPDAPLVIESANVTNPDPTKCVYGWSVTLKNNTAKDMKIAVQALQTQSPWGESKVTVPAGKTAVASVKDLPLTQAGGPTFLFLAVDETSGKRLGFKYAQPPMVSYNGLEFSAKSTSMTAFSWSVTNPAAFAFPASDLTFKASVAGSQTGPWTTPAGDAVGTCIAGGGSVTIASPKPESATHAQINVMKWNVAARSKVVAIAPPPPSARIATRSAP